ncbi:MAG: hypothetical protein ACFFA2_15180 [Promethearchaeota archaeon]
MESQRKVPKELIHFGKREYREKKPNKVHILRIKDKTVFKRGLLPSLVIKQHPAIQYVVLAEYIDLSRLYFFTSTGTLLEAENVEPKSPILKKLAKASKVLYRIPY